ncbi:MAG TPA: hypothetical protein VGW76_02495 [Pyrinomonadaceae bacterium]|nr:hypothetical protein [Pyrinomonadaceae bacterium]
MSKRKEKKWLKTGVVIAALLVVFLVYPFDTTVVPEWKLRVVDETGKPIPNVVVREQWRNHAVEFHGHNEDRTTNNEGYISFPRRTVRAPILFRVLGRAVVAFNVHGESGSRA